MNTKNQGFFWHVHHDVLIEWCHNYTERADYIRQEKAMYEQEIRLRLFRPVKGDLPQEVIEARQAYDQAMLARNQARRAYDQAWQFYYQARQAYNQAEQAYDQARLARNQAGQAYDQVLKRNESAIAALHKIECPNCPWNGQTIFP